MNSLRVALPAFLVAINLAGCSSSGGEALLSGSVAGATGVSNFTAATAVAGLSGTSHLLMFSTGALECSDLHDVSPPGGFTASVEISSFDIGQYNGGLDISTRQATTFSDNSVSAGVTVNITAADATSLTGTVAYTDSNMGLNGTFTIVLCAN